MSPDKIKKLKQHIEYDPITGIFTWIKPTSNRVKVGMPVGNKNGLGYMETRILGERYLLHRLAWAFTFGEVPDLIDHINEIPWDNRIDNLRPANKSLNGRNKKTARSDSASGIRGVMYSSRYGYWEASMKINGVKIRECFRNKDQAIAFRQALEEKYI